MKFFYLFLIFIFSFGEVFADEEIMRVGMIRQLIKEGEFEGQKKSKEFQPKIISRLVTDISLNDEYQSTDRKDEFRNDLVRLRFNSSINFAKNFSINTFLRLNQFTKNSELNKRKASANGGGDRSFEDQDLILQELNISYDKDRHAFLLGKFDLNFGSAWQWNRGIWNHDIANNYRQREKLGFAGVYRIGDIKKTGRYEFGYSIFTNDRKNFDNSIINKRDSDSKSDATPGDTRSLKSYDLSLDIDFDFAEKEKLSYHFSYVDLAVNAREAKISPTKLDSQKGFAAGMNYKYPVIKNFDIDALLEYAKIKNYQGNSDIGEKYFSGNVIGRIYQNWNITFGYSESRNIEVQSFGYDKNLSEISFGYEFQKNSFFDKLLLQAGYKNQRDNYKTSLESRNSVGILMRYQKNF